SVETLRISTLAWIVRSPPASTWGLVQRAITNRDTPDRARDLPPFSCPRRKCRLPGASYRDCSAPIDAGPRRAPAPVRRETGRFRAARWRSRNFPAACGPRPACTPGCGGHLLRLHPTAVCTHERSLDE